MKKAVSNFILKEDLESLLVSDWEEKSTNDCLAKAMDSIEKKINIDRDNPEFDEYLKSLGIPKTQSFLLQIEFSIILRNFLKENSKIKFLYPVVDNGGVCRGYFASFDYLSGNLVVDSPVDTLLQDSWDVDCKITNLGGSIYPCSGMIYYDTNPNMDNWVKSFAAMPGETLYFFQLKEIFSDIAPNESADNLSLYYSILKDNGVFSTIQLLPFVVLKELGVVKDGIKFEDYHRLVSQSYIEF